MEPFRHGKRLCLYEALSISECVGVLIAFASVVFGDELDVHDELDVDYRLSHGISEFLFCSELSDSHSIHVFTICSQLRVGFGVRVFSISVSVRVRLSIRGFTIGDHL